MNDFDYVAPGSVAEATSLLAQAGRTARVLAGGTDLLVQLRERLRDADLVVDVKKIPELNELSYDRAAGLTLGASVPCYRVHENEEVLTAYPALADSARLVGGRQIQSRASVGGNLCNASPAADTIPSLIVLQATCRIAGPDGSREVAAQHFCTGPGKTVLRRGELLTSIVFPPPAPNSGSAYERFIPRNEMDIAVAGAAAWVRLSGDGETIEQARIALAAVAPTPLFAQEASQWLTGKPASETTFAQAGGLARQIARPISDMRGTAEYRAHLVGVLVQRTLAKAVERALVK